MKGEPLYNPNEADLKTTALDAYIAMLQPLTDNVNDTLKAVEDAIEYRNNELYAATTGVFDLQAAVKKYVLSAVGSGSPIMENNNLIVDIKGNK